MFICRTWLIFHHDFLKLISLVLGHDSSKGYLECLGTFWDDLKTFKTAPPGLIRRQHECIAFVL